MSRYDYACPRCGTVEVVRPLGTASAQEPCPECGRPAARVYSAPMLGSSGSAVRGLREAAERSAHEPEVRRRAPSAARSGRPPVNPLHARLPRP